MTERERVGPEEEHRANDIAREGGAHPDRVAGEEVRLEAAGIGRRDERGGQVAEPGGDPVDDVAGCDEAIDDLACLLHAGAGVRCRG